MWVHFSSKLPSTWRTRTHLSSKPCVSNNYILDRQLAGGCHYLFWQTLAILCPQTGPCPLALKLPQTAVCVPSRAHHIRA